MVERSDSDEFGKTPKFRDVIPDKINCKDTQAWVLNSHVTFNQGIQHEISALHQQRSALQGPMKYMPNTGEGYFPPMSCGDVRKFKAFGYDLGKKEDELVRHTDNAVEYKTIFAIIGPLLDHCVNVQLW